MRFRSIALVATFSNPFYFFAAATAQQPLEHMTVTASRTPVALWEAGASVMIIDSAEIERRQSPFLIDLLRTVPGLAVSQQGGAGKFAQVRVRGAEANQVLVMIDGIEVNDLTRADDFDFSTLTTSDIERVEVVRGPQSSLWGSDALAGVINIITKESASRLEAEVAAEGGSFAGRQLSGSVGRIGDDYRFRIGANRLTTGGTNVSTSGDEDDAYEVTSVNAKANWQMHDAVALDANARVADSANETDSSGFGVNPLDSDADTDRFEAYVAAKVRADVLDGRWTHGVGGAWTRTDNSDEDRLIGTYGRVQGDKVSIDYQTTIRFETPRFYNAMHSTTFAVDYEERSFKQRGPISFGADPNQDRKIDTIGYVGEYRLRIFNGSSLSGSVRHDDSSDFDSVTTFRVALSQRFANWGTLLSGAYGTGQKDPTFYDRFGFSSGGFFPFIGNENLQPEKSKGWEVSLQQPFYNDRLTFGATYFSERLTDEINGFVLDFATFTATAENLDGTSHRDGVELFANASLTNELSAAASYTYLDANQIGTLTGTRTDEIRRPRHSGSASINYSFSGGRGNVNLHTTYTGVQNDDTFLLPFFTPQRVNLSAFTLFGASGSWQIDDIATLFGRVENILDDDYEEVFAFQAPGVAAYIGIRFNFSR